jgi:non-lysosomal glucosylceramidase
MPKIPYPDNELYELGPQTPYAGRNLDEIAFPLGGIGTGSVSLGGWGQLRDWEIMNKPAKGFVVPRAFFIIKAQAAGKALATKVLQGPVGGSYAGDGHSLVRSYEQNELGQGLPHFKKAKFTGTFPIATLVLDEPEIPLHVNLEAFSPFIPLNDKDSSIPVAVLAYTLENISDSDVSATIYGNLSNIIGGSNAEGQVNEKREQNGITGLYVSNKRLDKDSPEYGSMALATTCPNSAVWVRWKDLRLSKFWETIVSSKIFPPKESGDTDTGTVAATVQIKSGKKATVIFLLAWHFPTFEYYWGIKGKNEKLVTWPNYYASLWRDAWNVTQYTASNLKRLWEETRLFRDALFASTLPAHVLDAVSSQLSTLKTTTCLRLEDGTFYGFEGSSETRGCCEGSCTHVWNYAQALPYLFPNLQRSMIEAHLANSVEKDGFMTFRMPLPLGTKAEPSFHPAADGQMGIILQVYRDWLLSGDDKWLRTIWPTAKKLLEFAWKYWDADKDGVMEGMQHNTYDIEFYGPNTMMGSLYLAALRAAQQMAEYLGESEKAQEYLELFRKGSKWTDDNLFNGEFYKQKVNPAAREIWPERQRELAEAHGKDDRFRQWPKWQFGKGCLSDQMIGQWYAHMLGLGYLYKPANVRKTVKSIFKYNWKPDLSSHPCFLRIYAVNDEAGLVICTWPNEERPGYAFYFADEVWCGIEYQVANHMIHEGMVKEGLAIIKGVRNRHRGDRRNPWDEFECGHHYARSMASYAALLALSGFSYSTPKRRLGFIPKICQENFRTFFSTATGWGLYTQKTMKGKSKYTLELKHGLLYLNELDVPLAKIEEITAVATLDSKQIDVKITKAEDTIAVLFDSITIEKGQTLKVSIRHK